MFIFYEFNTINMMTVLISTLILYYYFSINDNKNKKNDSVQIDKLLLSIFIALLISIGIAYVMSGQEEMLLTDNYWDSNNLE